MKDIDDIPALMAEIGQRARDASASLAFAPAPARAKALSEAALAVLARMPEIRAANARDMEHGREKGLSAAMLDRLLLDTSRIEGIAQGLQAVAGQADPVGRVLARWERPSGLRIRRVATPLGVVGVIYESRPNVTADAGALCLKAGNAVILRGGSESFHSSQAIHECLVVGLRAAGLPEDAIQLVPTRDREAVTEMLTMTGSIDVIVPRGGKRLVGLVQAKARVPVFAHLEGIVHVYLDRGADRQKALDVVLNAKTRRPGICGAAECLLIHRDIADGLGREVMDALEAAGVELRRDEDSWGREFLDMVMAVRVVDDIDAAIAHIRRYGSEHTDAIVTEDASARERFFERLDSAILMHNASTQFADGGEFGMGAEIGIATGKMHARGPVGADQLTSFKYLVEGDGTTRP